MSAQRCQSVHRRSGLTLSERSESEGQRADAVSDTGIRYWYLISMLLAGLAALTGLALSLGGAQRTEGAACNSAAGSGLSWAATIWSGCHSATPHSHGNSLARWAPLDLDLTGWAQRIERREATGFGGAEEARAHIGTHQDRAFSREIQCTSQDQRISSGKMILDDQWLAHHHVAARHIDQSDSLHVNILVQVRQRQFPSVSSDAAPLTELVQHRDGLYPTECTRQPLHLSKLKQLQHGLRAHLSVIALDQCAGIKEVEHLVLVPHAGDFLREASFERCQRTMNSFERNPFSQDVRRGDQIFAPNDWDPSSPQRLNTRMVYFDVNSHRGHLLSYRGA